MPVPVARIGITILYDGIKDKSKNSEETSLDAPREVDGSENTEKPKLKPPLVE
jgi:hypothetical protein